MANITVHMTWKLVPVIPPRAMVKAGELYTIGTPHTVWKHMLSASPDPATDEALVERVARAIWDERCKHWGKYRKHLHEPNSEGYDWDDLSLSKRKELMREALAVIRAMEINNG